MTTCSSIPLNTEDLSIYGFRCPEWILGLVSYRPRENTACRKDADSIQYIAQNQRETKCGVKEEEHGSGREVKGEEYGEVKGEEHGGGGKGRGTHAGNPADEKKLAPFKKRTRKDALILRNHSLYKDINKSLYK